MHWLLWLAVPASLLPLAGLVRAGAEKREARLCKPPGEWIEVQGRRLHIRRIGSGGPSIVFESGGAFSSAMWWPLQDQLADLSTVVAYDRAGLGWSDPAPLPRSIEERADELFAVLQVAGVPAPYVLVGLSYGGPLIRSFAARHREMVAGLVFVDIAHEAVFGTGAAQTYLRRCSVALRIIGALAMVGLPRLLRMRGLPQSSTSLPWSDAQRRTLQSRFARARSFFTGADEFTSMLRIAEAMQGLGTPGLLGSLPLSVLSHGKPFPGPFAVLEHNHEAGQRALVALSDRSEFIVAERSSHAIPLEEPELVIEAVRRVWHMARQQSISSG